MTASAPAPPHSILVVLHVENHSGPQRSLGARLEYLSKQGTRITTLLPRAGPAAERAHALGDVVLGVPGALLAPRSPVALTRMAGAARRQAARVEEEARAAEADLVIVSSARMPGALRGARRAGAATLLYGGELLSGPLSHRLLGSLIGRHAARSADSIVVPSARVARWYAERGAKAHLVHPAIEPPDADAPQRARAFRTALGIGEHEAVVATLGAITRGRGQDVLVRALASERAAGRSWRLVIGGEAYDRPADRGFDRELRRLPAELGVADAVTFAGRVDDPDAFHAATDVFVNPARTPESFGRAACEALAAGVPVVSTLVGGVTAALRAGESALIVEPDDPGGLALAVRKLLEDEALAARLAASGKADVEARFSPAVESPRFEAAVLAALAASRR